MWKVNKKTSGKFSGVFVNLERQNVYILADFMVEPNLALWWVMWKVDKKTSEQFSGVFIVIFERQNVYILADFMVEPNLALWWVIFSYSSLLYPFFALFLSLPYF